MMSAGHSSRGTAPSTLVTTYIAKRRAEVAPGVSADTDIILLGPQPGTLNTIKEEIHVKMKAEYATVLAEEKNLQRIVINKVDEYVSSISEKPSTAVEDQGEARSADASDVAAEAKKDGRGSAERPRATKGQR